MKLLCFTDMSYNAKNTSFWCTALIKLVILNPWDIKNKNGFLKYIQLNKRLGP